MKQKLSILYVFVLALVIVATIPGCVKKRPPSIPIETYEFHCRNLSDNELIAEFYQVDMELQEALDDLQIYQRGLERAAAKGGFFGALGYRTGAGGSPKYRVKELRMRKAILLTIIHQRGLTLPVSVK